MLSVLQRPNQAYLLLSASHVRPKYNRLVKLCTALYHFQINKMETIIPSKKALTTLRKTSVNKNSSGPQTRTPMRIHAVVSQKGTCQRGSDKIFVQEVREGFPYKLSYKHLQAPSISSRKGLLDVSSRMCAISPHKHLYKKGLGYPQDHLARTRLESS